jgi:hypothetical protein
MTLRKFEAYENGYCIKCSAFLRLDIGRRCFPVVSRLPCPMATAFSISKGNPLGKDKKPKQTTVFQLIEKGI